MSKDLWEKKSDEYWVYDDIASVGLGKLIKDPEHLDEPVKPDHWYAWPSRACPKDCSYHIPGTWPAGPFETRQEAMIALEKLEDEL